MFGFGVASLVLGFISAASYWSTTHLIQATSEVTHSRAILDELDEVPLQLALAEVAQRTYLLSGDERFLTAYHAAETAIKKEITDVRKLIADNPAWQQQLGTVEFRVAEGFRTLQWTLDLRKSQGLKAAAGDLTVKKSEDIEADVQALTRAIETDEQNLLQHQLRHTDHSAVRALTAIIVSSSLAIGMVVLAGVLVRRDLRRRQRAEAALHTSEERYRNLIETARDGIAAVAVDGTISNVNHALESMLQWPRQELLGRHCREILTPASAAQWEDRLRYALAVERLPSMYEAELVRKDGRVVPVEVQASFLRDEQSDPTEILALFRDVTMREKVL